VQGKTRRADVAVQLGASPAQLGRWLRGDAEPRLPSWLALVDALTGRVGDLVAEIVPIEEVPALEGGVRDRRAVQSVLSDEPWTPAVLAAVPALRSREPAAPTIARRLGLPLERVQAILEVLERGGVLRRRGTQLTVDRLTVDVPPDTVRRMQQHWATVGTGRLEDPGPGDRFSFNVCGLSRGDLQRVVELQAAYFRQLRAIAAESEPVETVALITMHVCSWEP